VYGNRILRENVEQNNVYGNGFGRGTLEIQKLYVKGVKREF